MLIFELLDHLKSDLSQLLRHADTHWPRVTDPRSSGERIMGYCVGPAELDQEAKFNINSFGFWCEIRGTPTVDMYRYVKKVEG